MSYITEKVAYLDGLADGLGIREDERDGKLLCGIIDVLGAIAESLEDHDEQLSDLNDCVEDIYDELDELCGCDGECDDCFDENDFVETVCPSCGETVYFDEDMLDSEDGLICPNCNAPIELEIPVLEDDAETPEDE